MISKEELFAATDKGMLILELHFPGVREAAMKKQPFRMRPDERTPSTYVTLIRQKNGLEYWGVTDFGDEAKAVNPLQVHMNQTGLDFSHAMRDLMTKFNLSDGPVAAAYKPDIRKVPAEAGQEDGTTSWEINQNFTEKECRIMGPRVTVETLKALNWYRADHVVSIKNREAVYKYSNENYPIFIRECWFYDPEGNKDRFYKIYEPLNIEKKWRFQYQPAGKKPQSYINGLFELRKAFNDYNETARAQFYKDPKNENKEYENEKFERAIICSGERDAICVKALGYFPLWFNSETYQVSPKEIREIMKYVKVLYNIPDLDATGVRRGTDLALKYIDIHTVWLDKELKNFRDRRGNPCKDFRDWCEHWKTKEDFKNRLEIATPAKFWTVNYREKDNSTRYSIDISCLHEFLKLNGFHTLHDPNHSDVQFVKITHNVVKEVTSKEIRDFVKEWSFRTGQPRPLRNLILSTPTLSQASLEALDEVDPDFTNYTERSQYFYFPKFSIEVTGKEMIKREYRNTVAERYVWDDNVIDHDVKILPDMFEITNESGSERSEDFDIDIKDKCSKYFRYLINSSRIYWRKEMEEIADELEGEEREKYLKEISFKIDGDRLTPEEIKEQKQCLISKIFTIGYLMHRYKQESKAWAPFVMDNIVGDSEQCNGRSGKSLMFKALTNFTKGLKLSGRNPKFFDNQFCFEMVNRHQTFVVVDDCDKYLPFRQFYDNITSDITINAKNVKSYNLNYFEAPKFVFTTNYVPRDCDTSSVARMLFVVFSDYYHVSTDENDYRETRSVHDDFGKDLFSAAYTEQEWEADINFIMQCVRFYLSLSRTSIKIQPKLDNIIFRRHIQEMSEGFRDWAESFFSVDEYGDGENLNRRLVKADVFEAYKRHSGQFKVTMPRFTKSLKSFCYTCDYIDSYNPEDQVGKDGRIMQKVRNEVTGKSETKEMIYIRTKRAAKIKAAEDKENGGFRQSDTPSDLFASGSVFEP